MITVYVMIWGDCLSVRDSRNECEINHVFTSVGWGRLVERLFKVAQRSNPDKVLHTMTDLYNEVGGHVYAVEIDRY